MKNFTQFYNQLITQATDKTILSIDSQQKQIKAMVRLTAVNYLKDNGEYVKIKFKEGGFLLMIPEEKECYYSNIGDHHIKEIPDEAIGKQKIIKYNNKTYELDNKDDYQFVLQLHVGSPLAIEGECSFSDYFPTSGPKEFLSLGWLSRTGKRADINPVIIDNSQVDIFKL
jgi:hypothetical protein